MPTYTPQDIRSIRKRLHLTQQEFGQLLGCSVKTVSSWESGYRNPSGTARTAITQLAARNQAPKRRHRPGTSTTTIKHGILTTLRGQQHTAYGYQWTTNNQQPTTTTSRKQHMKPTYTDIHQWTNIRERP